MMWHVGTATIKVEPNWEAWEMQAVLDQLLHAAQEIEAMIEER